MPRWWRCVGIFGTIEGYFTDGLCLEADTLKELRFALTETDDG